MSFVFFPVSKVLLTDNYMKKNSTKDCAVNVKKFEVTKQVKIYQDGRLTTALNLQEKVQKELVGR